MTRAQVLPKIAIPFAEEGRHGIDLYNDGQYWEAHEAWEVIWHKKSGREKSFYQGMIHVAAGMLKINRAQFEGAHSQLTRALERFAVAGPMETGTNDEAFRKRAAACRDEVLRLGPADLEQFDRKLYPVIEICKG